MRIVLIGMGEVGRYLVERLEREGHDLIAIDRDPVQLREMEEDHDVATLQGYGASPKLLEEAGCETADLVVAVTHEDEVNLLAALTARAQGAKEVIARVHGLEFTGDVGILRDFLGVDLVINPRVLVAREMSHIARSYGALDVMRLAEDQVELVELELPAQSRMLHKTLAELVSQRHLPPEVLVAAVISDGKLRVPGGSDVLLPGDRVLLIGRRDQMREAEGRFVGHRAARRICILGGGVVGQLLLENLRGHEVEVTLIERSLERARDLAAEFPQVAVMHGDGTQMGFLEETLEGGCDLFFATTGQDEVNLMSGLLARRCEVPRCVSLVHRPDYVSIYRHLGIDVALSPRMVVSEQIFQRVRQTRLESLIMLENGQGEVLELVAPEDSRILDLPISQLGLPPGAILTTLIRQQEIIIPRGNHRVRAGDTVIMLLTSSARSAVERLFQRRIL